MHNSTWAHCKHPLALIALLALAVFSLMTVSPALAHAATGGEQAFSNGVAAYRAGHHAEAVSQFQAAERAGLRTGNLYFNLGLAHYRLNQLAAAQRALALSARAPGFEGASLFQLGLIAHRQGRKDDALRLLASAEHAQPSLAPRVAVARQRISGEAAAIKRTRYYAFLGGGYDSNISLSDDRPESFKISSSFAEGLGEISHRSKRLEGLLRGYVQEAFSNHDFDVLAAEAHGYLHFRSLGANTRVGPAVGVLRFGGESFSRQVGLRSEWVWAARQGRPRHRLAYEGDRVMADAPFQGFDGQRHILRYGLSGQRYDLRYHFEWNDRDGTEGAETFSSQSPVRHTLLLTTQLLRAETFELLGGLQYRLTRYRENERFVDDQLMRVEQRRKEDRYQARLTTRFDRTRFGQPLAELRATLNETNLERFDYDRIEAVVGLEWF